MSDICYSVTTLTGGAGGASRVASRINSPVGGPGGSSVCGYMMDGGVTLGGIYILKISANCFKYYLFFSHSFVIGIARVGLRRSWVNSVTA